MRQRHTQETVIRTVRLTKTLFQASHCLDNADLVLNKVTVSNDEGIESTKFQFSYPLSLRRDLEGFVSDWAKNNSKRTLLQTEIVNLPCVAL